MPAMKWTCLCVVLMVLLGSESHQQRETKASSPSLLLSESPAAKMMKYHLIAWPDGTVLLRDKACDASSPMLLAKVEPHELDEVLRQLDNLGFFKSIGSTRYAPDSSYVTIEARLGDKHSTYSWEGRFLSIDVTKPDQRDFLRLWLRSKAAISSLCPIELHQLKDNLDSSGCFRGYNDARPWESRF